MLFQSCSTATHFALCAPCLAPFALCPVPCASRLAPCVPRLASRALRSVFCALCPALRIPSPMFCAPRPELCVPRPASRVPYPVFCAPSPALCILSPVSSVCLALCVPCPAPRVLCFAPRAFRAPRPNSSACIFYTAQTAPTGPKYLFSLVFLKRFIFCETQKMKLSLVL